MRTVSEITRLVLLAALCQCVALGGTNFVNVKLDTGFSLDLPRNWWLIQAELNKTIETSAQAVLDLSGIEMGERNDINLIAANCQPKYMYASVRVNVRRHPLTTPEMARRLTAADLAEMGADAKKMLVQALLKQGLELRDYISTTKEEVAGFPAIVSHARRTDDPRGQQTVLVWIIQIFAPGRTYRLNLAYRESEAAFWKPVVERIKKSIKIENQMANEK